MSRVVRAFAAHLRASTGVMLQYRGEILLWSIWGIINPAVLYAMWSSAAEGNATGTVAGLDPAGLAAYYFIMMIVGHVTAAWDAYETSHLVQSGALSPMLLRPLLPMWETLSHNVAYKITTLMFVIPMWAIFFLWVRPRFEAEGWQYAIGTAALVMGGVLNYILCYTVSLTAFWVTKLDALGEIYFGLCMFLGGRFVPLEAIPEPISTVAWYLPFCWMFYFPTELLIGRVSDGEAAWLGLRIQVVWFVLTVIAFRFLWRRAIRRYTAVSG